MHQAPPDGVPNPTDPTVRVFLELGDHLGSNSVVLDLASGELVERTTAYAYGAVESDYRPGRWGEFREEYRFTGKEEDVEVGLIYFGKSSAALAPCPGSATFSRMQSLKARVRNGRLVLDEPTDLPEGTEVLLNVADVEDDLDEDERERLHEALRRSMAQARAGQVVDADKVIDRPLSRGG